MARRYQLDPTSSPASGQGASSGIDYAAELNPEQHAAVSSPPGRALVIAGAGSGKTRTLTYRVAWLLDHGTEPRQILLLTFTNKAAREMTERVRALVPQDLGALWAGTFHSIGNRILRRNADAIGFTRSFSIMDRDDQKSLLALVMKDIETETRGARFPKADVLLSIFSLAENMRLSLHRILESRYPYFLDFEDAIQSIREAYRSRKQETNSMDFDDLLVKTVALLEDQPEILEMYQRKFRHILVDEYQDTNAIQGRMIDLLAGERNSLMAVGDDSQSIYSWRGAELEHILAFPQRYRGSMLFKIETNYRSVPEILDLSNAAIRGNRARFEKDLKSARAPAGVRPAVVPLDEPSLQGAFVAQRIAELVETGVSPASIAVLYRAHFHSLEVQMELSRRGIPFAITSGIRFFEQSHVKDVAAFLRFVTNRKDEVSFKRMVMLLPGLGPGTAEKLWRAWLAGGAAEAEEPPASWSALLGGMKVSAKSAPHWTQLGHTLDELSPEGVFASPSDMIYSVLEGVYDEFLKAAYDNYEQRRGDVEKLMEFAAGFEDIMEFLSQLSLLSNVDGDPAAEKERKAREKELDRVTLSSIHQAKGLEWEVVFVIWLADGQFPNGRVIEAENESLMEEERRLFYVALTRAKDELYLTYPLFNPKSYSGDVYCRPSRFLQECPAEMLEPWQVGGAGEWEDDEPF